ncbi:hypothetical protein [Limnoglobus roseus]|uniref:TIGR03067 domain-containing protein n=1 Tax=Limnoglobus roseus TaxID=2598579 RepID=A0A5C1AQL9_9BACT|nr:hypothetical protein [Limnoglobus roseus]QEL20343.1 hypothetical protein PX52LOC_07436 [Limnoglobus roseus]
MRLLRSLPLALATLALAAGLGWAEPFENPTYKQWAAFKPGATATVKTESEFNNMKSEVTIISKLVEVGKDKLVLETTTVSKFNGMEFKQPPTKQDVLKTIDLPKTPATGDKPKDKSEDPKGKTEEGTETLKVGGQDVKTKWVKYKNKTTDGEVESQTWMSDEVPGQIVKSVTKTATVKTTMELTEFKKP